MGKSTPNIYNDNRCGLKYSRNISTYLYGSRAFQFHMSITGKKKSYWIESASLGILSCSILYAVCESSQ